MTGKATPEPKAMTSEYVLRKNRKKGGKSTRGPPGIGFNLTENGDYDIAGHKLVNVKQPENPGDAVNLQYLASANDNMIKKDDSESVLKIVKPELSNMIRKDDSETVLKIVKPELSNMIKKDDSETVVKIVRQSLNSVNIIATKRYIDIGNRRIVKTADAIDKYDVVNKGQLDIYGERLINLETEFMKKTHYSFLQFVGKINFEKGVHDKKIITMLKFTFDGEYYLSIPINMEVIKFRSTADLTDLEITNNEMKKFDLSKPFSIKETDLLLFRIKKEKVNTDENLGGYNHNKPYRLKTPIRFYMLVKFSL
ncbi:hypothetical protein TcasGA2_TC003105 [Tribolium castaneum]|uniref:Uncharacterized protein n=1 Tax=Tribolium castaneum TaxID=7070 RepID=D6WFC1_TRICA|nr:hypothetical protein TcasGA2_TC003105 [Tribolium castaneum]